MPEHTPTTNTIEDVPDAALTSAIAVVEPIASVQHALMLVSLTTGLSTEAAFEMRWSCIDEDNAICLVYDPAGQRIRTIPLPQIVMDALVRLRRDDSDWVLNPDEDGPWPCRLAIDLNDGRSGLLTDQHFADAFFRTAARLGHIQALLDVDLPPKHSNAAGRLQRHREAIEDTTRHFVPLIQKAQGAKSKRSGSGGNSPQVRL